MSSQPLQSKVKSVIYCVLAFLLSLALFVTSFCVVLEATVLNPNFIMNNMNSSSYFADKCEEITVKLVDLGYASGLDESFFEGFLDEVMLSEDTKNYLDDYYSNKGTVVDDTAFKQSFNTALDEYIKKNSIENVNGDSREYLIKQAAKIYRNALQIPMFGTLSTYILSLKKIMPYVLAGLLVFIAAVCLVIVLTNKWKHRAVRYLCYASTGATLAVGIIPIALLISGKINHINLDSRALYNLFVQSANDVLIALLFCAAFFLLVSVGLYFWHRTLRKHAKA